jgi:hypothetical protein
MVRTPAGHLQSPPMVAAHLFPEPAAGEPYTILIMAQGLPHIQEIREVLKCFSADSADVRYESEHKKDNLNRPR